MDIKRAKAQRNHATRRAHDRADKRLRALAGLSVGAAGIVPGDTVRLHWNGYRGVPQWLAGHEAIVRETRRTKLVVEATAEPGVRRTIDVNQCCLRRTKGAS